jgi:hypothetical protein
MAAKQVTNGRRIVGRSRKSAPRSNLDDREGRHDGSSDVGFGKPPKGTRFKPGVSGNPKGRPKWKDNGMLTDLIGRELYRSVRISQNGETVSMPALQVALRRLVRMGAEGNPKSVETMLKIARDHNLTAAEDERGRIAGMTEEERMRRIMELLERGRRRLLAREEKARIQT